MQKKKGLSGVIGDIIEVNCLIINFSVAFLKDSKFKWISLIIYEISISKSEFMG